MAESSYRLVMRNGPNPGQVFDLLQPEVTIGRDINNTIVVNDPEISRKHTRLFIQGGNYQIEDTGSTNGTFVNGQRLMGPHLLRPGEVIFLGETVSLIFEAMQFDPNATVASTPRIKPEPAQPSASYPPPDYAAQPAYTSQVPAGPPEAYAEEDYEEPKSNRTKALLGCGCLVVVACVLGAAFLAFDWLNLYCVSPFDALSGILWDTCP